LHSQQYDHAVFLYAFDLLELNGTDLRREPLEQRKQVLEKLLQNCRPGICYSKHLEGEGEKIFAYACRVGLEGIVSKRRDAPYRSGHSKNWVTIKNPKAQRYDESPTTHGKKPTIASAKAYSRLNIEPRFYGRRQRDLSMARSHQTSAGR
jgi:hypothetical protein